MVSTSRRLLLTVEVALLEELNTRHVVLHMKSIFARHGIPEILTSDNGPQYASEEFRKFVHEYAFQHATSSPKYPQSAAERAVQTMKSLLKKENDPYMALLAYRTSPLENGASPAELLMGRKLRSTVPTLPKVLQPQLPDATQIRLKESKSRGLTKLQFDAKELPALSVGEKVWIKDLERPANVISPVPGTPRSYLVKSSGGTVRRNRRSLTALCEPSDVPPDISSTDSQIVALDKPITPTGNRKCPVMVVRSNQDEFSICKLVHKYRCTRILLPS